MDHGSKYKLTFPNQLPNQINALEQTITDRPQMYNTEKEVYFGRDYKRFWRTLRGYLYGAVLVWTYFCNSTINCCLSCSW